MEDLFLPLLKIILVVFPFPDSFPGVIDLEEHVNNVCALAIHGMAMLLHGSPSLSDHSMLSKRMNENFIDLLFEASEKEDKYRLKHITYQLNL